ncbi:hypothetical protein ACUOA5_46035, partial [Escherichia coli]
LKISEVAYTLLEWLKGNHKLEDEIIYLESDLDRSKKELKRWIYSDLQEVRLTEGAEGGKLEDRIAVREHDLAFEHIQSFALFAHVYYRYNADCSLILQQAFPISYPPHTYHT